MHSHRIQVVFFLALLFVALALTFVMFLPYLSALFMSLVFYIVSRPVFERILRLVGGKVWLAALFTTLLIVVIIILPLIIFGVVIFDDARNFYVQLTSGDGGLLDSWQGYIDRTITRLIPEANINLEQFIGKGLNYLLNNIAALFAGFLGLILNLVIMLVSLFFLFKDGDRLKAAIFDISPLSNNYDQNIFDQVEMAVSSVVKGNLLIAILQGIVSSVGFAIFGVSNPALWGTVAAVAALIPSVGTSVVLIPVVLYVFVSSGIGNAIGLAIWGVVFVGLIDNILYPILVERGIRIHPFLIFLAVLGGVSVFGLLGFIIGPVVLSVLFILSRMFPRIISKKTA